MSTSATSLPAALIYIVFGLFIALLVAGALRTKMLSRFDENVPTPHPATSSASPSAMNGADHRRTEGRATKVPKHGGFPAAAVSVSW